MRDLIDRAAAITAIQNAYCDTEGGEDKCAVWKNVGLTNALHIMQDLSSAQPERKKGKWIYNSPVTMKCNQCGLVIKDCDWHRFKYCPNCIADMRGEQDG